jgi:thiosulfate/3-mercaptopyruvate sulfurtransferase
MRVTRILALSLALVAATGAHAPAASPREALVVSTAWLAQHLHDANLVLLHVGAKADYDAQHIPGARYVAVTPDLAAPNNGLNNEMLPPDVLHDRLAALGISDNSRIVVSYDKSMVAQATRVVFTLDYAGLGSATSLLDGGLTAWARDGHDMTRDVPPARTGTLAPLTLRPIVVDAEYVLAHLKTPHVAIVDGRAAAFYDGSQTGGSTSAPHRTGHIAGAYSVPYSSVTDEQAALRSAQELEAIFTKAGVQPDDTIIGYCHSGQQATAMLFAARTLGHPVLLYDGSFEDWSRHPDYPVDNPAKRGGTSSADSARQ